MIIYKITNKINGKIYIGQTTRSLRERWNGHCCKNTSNRCRLLGRAIQKYGKESFTIEQIDIACDQGELDKKESYWITFYDSMNKEKGYNLTSGGEHPVISDETKLKMRLNHADFSGEKNSNWGKHWSDDVKRKISNSLKGKYVGENAGFYGRKHTKESIEKIKSARSGKHAGVDHWYAKRVICVETGEVFDCIREAAQATGANRRHISCCCQGKRKTCGGYHWQYLKEIK